MTTRIEHREFTQVIYENADHETRTVEAERVIDGWGDPWTRVGMKYSNRTILISDDALDAYIELLQALKAKTLQLES